MPFCEEQAFERGYICSVRLTAKGFHYLENPFSILMHFIFTVSSSLYIEWAKVYGKHSLTTVCQKEKPSLK